MPDDQGSVIPLEGYDATSQQDDSQSEILCPVTGLISDSETLFCNAGEVLDGQVQTVVMHVPADEVPAGIQGPQELTQLEGI